MTSVLTWRLVAILFVVVAQFVLAGTVSADGALD